jgi:GH25 family lysozyme M1 (1,4-beta-N-acetylmuramidase)
MRADRYKHENVKKGKKTLRLLICFIVLMVLVIAVVLWSSYNNTFKSLSVKFTDNSPELEFGDEYDPMDFVSSSTGKVTPSAKKMDTATLGNKEIVYKVTERMYGGLVNPTKEFTLNYEVVDTIPPVILYDGDGTILKNGEVFDINNVLAYGDNADETPAAKVSGKVDMNKNGKYPLDITVSDSSGNKTKCTMTIEVADSVPPGPDTAERIQFGDFVSDHKGDKKAFGIDVSSWQGDIDFEKVKDAGCEFVVIRIGYSADGKVTIDSKYDDNMRKAKKAGLKVGVYMYSYDNNEAAVRASAQEVLEKLDGIELDMPIAFDWEDFTHFQSYEMSFSNLNMLYDVFAEEVRKAGYTCMLYSSKKYLELVWDKTDKRIIWVARYGDKSGYDGPRIMWQASNIGRIDGIGGDVDLDIMYYN